MKFRWMLNGRKCEEKRKMWHQISSGFRLSAGTMKTSLLPLWGGNLIQHSTPTRKPLTCRSDDDAAPMIKHRKDERAFFQVWGEVFMVLFKSTIIRTEIVHFWMRETWWWKNKQAKGYNSHHPPHKILHILPSGVYLLCVAISGCGRGEQEGV